jgi:hypothetical protein
VVENTLEQETKYFHFMEERNQIIEPLLRKSSVEWTNLQEKFIQHSKSMGKWVCRPNRQTNPVIKQNIVSSRHRQKKIEDPSTSKQSEEKENKWV